MCRNRIIEGCYLTSESNNITVYVKLNPDKELITGYFKPPIKWSGKVKDYQVEITQIKHTAYNQSDFNFSNFPEEFNGLKDEIVKAIDDAMKIMN